MEGQFLQSLWKRCGNFSQPPETKEEGENLHHLLLSSIHWKLTSPWPVTEEKGRFERGTIKDSEEAVTGLQRGENQKKALACNELSWNLQQTHNLPWEIVTKVLKEPVSVPLLCFHFFYALNVQAYRKALWCLQKSALLSGTSWCFQWQSHSWEVLGDSWYRAGQAGPWRAPHLWLTWGQVKSHRRKSTDTGWGEWSSVQSRPTPQAGSLLLLKVQVVSGSLGKSKYS